MLGDVQKLVLKEKFNEPYDPNEPIINIYRHIDDCLKLDEDADDIDFTAGQVLQQDLYSLQTTGLYRDKVR